VFLIGHSYGIANPVADGRAKRGAFKTRVEKYLLSSKS